MPSRLLAIFATIGVMGVLAFIAPFGIMPARASALDAPAYTTANAFGTCAALNYNPTGDLLTDLPLLVEYLDGFINNIYFCWLNQTLALMFRYVLYIVLLLQSMMIWFIRQMDALLSWAVNGLVYAPLFYIAGIIRNTGNQIIEAIYFSGGRTTTIVSGSGTTFWDVLIAIVNGLSSAINSLTTGLSSIFASLAGVLSTLIVQLGETIRAALSDTVGVIIALINAILIIIVTIIQIIGVIIMALISLFAIIVETVGAIALSIIQGVLGGFNATVTNPLSQISGLSSTSSVGSSVSSVGSSISSVTGVCSNNVVIHLCIGAYILDNTIFSMGSPATPAFFFLIGAVWFERIMWAMRKSKSIAK